jgi:hypothetical protein
MNPDAAPLWKHVLKTFSDDIYESKMLHDQWSKALAHFERICDLKGVVPFSRLASLALKVELLALQRAEHSDEE